MIHGQLHPDFWPIARVLKGQIRNSRSGGAAACVYHRGEKVVDIWTGNIDDEGHPWRADTMSVSFSTTKGVVSTVLHVLVDQGLLDYDDPVSKHWPEFADGGKQQITVRQLLCHEAGLFGLRSKVDRAERILDWAYMVEAMEESIPAVVPGTANGYHAFTYGWLVGELIQRVTGDSLAEVIERELVKPLDLDGVYVGAPPAVRHRIAPLIVPERMLNPPSGGTGLGRLLRGVARTLPLPINTEHAADALMLTGIEKVIFTSRIHEAPLPAVNGVFTARSLARIYAMLAGGGEIDGVRVMSRETIRRATEIQNRRRDLVVGFPMRWRLGYHLAATSRGILPHGFGHFGFGGSGAWADPSRNLAVALVMNRVAGTPFGDMRMLRSGAVAVRCADSR